jgi:3-hydroxyacyl-CoA dehydrogenase
MPTPPAWSAACKRVRDNLRHQRRARQAHARGSGRAPGAHPRHNLADAGRPDGADLFIEAVFEDLALKQRSVPRSTPWPSPGAILATNTSGLDIDAIAA